MKVNDPNLTGVGSDIGLDKARQTGATGRRGVGGGSRAGSGGGDSVSLSALSGQLRASNVDSPERAARMQKLSFSVDSREYNVDAGRLSYLLVEAALQPSG